MATPSTDSLTSTLGRAALTVCGLLNCESCLAHGHQCKGTHTNDAGRPVCVFCLDGVPCPNLKRKPIAPAPERKTILMTTKGPIRKCAAPSDCDTILRPSNKSGFCPKHFHLTRAKGSPSRSNGATASRAPRVNGNHHPAPVKRSNGHGGLVQLNLTEGQLNDFFLRLSVGERALIVNTFLAGGR